MSLRVLDPGLCTLVVDFGRPRSRSLGVPVGGAADRTSLALGNALVGNTPDAAALEFALTGPTLEAACELGCVVCGAPFQLLSDRQPLIVGKTFTLAPGEVVQVRGTPEGMRGYLCVRGGLQVPAVLGSRSWLTPLQAGDDLPCAPGSIRPRFVRPHFTWQRARERWRFLWGGRHRLRALRGPQGDWAPLGALFFSGAGIRSFRVSPASNRMGLRLAGDALPVPQRELLSEPVCPGTVQMTRDGQCILLGVDGQTIGGYPKIAQVISADLDLVGQLRPGEEICFTEVGLTEAETAWRAQEAELAAWILRLRAALEDPSLAAPAMNAGCKSC